VLCYHAWDARSFAFWSRPGDWVGRDGVFVAVGERPEDALRFDKWFARVEPIGGFEVKRGGAAVREVRLYRCAWQTAAFPFDDLGRRIRSRQGAGGGPERRVATGQGPPGAGPVR
jgi:hypothetical protein